MTLYGCVDLSLSELWEMVKARYTAVGSVADWTRLSCWATARVLVAGGCPGPVSIFPRGQLSHLCPLARLGYTSGFRIRQARNWVPPPPLKSCGISWGNHFFYKFLSLWGRAAAVDSELCQDVVVRLKWVGMWKSLELHRVLLNM